VTTWPGGITAITLFVEDVAAAKLFYGTVFDLPVVFEDANSAVFQFGSTLINLLISSEGPELVGPAPVGGADAGVRAQFTLDVDDVDERCAELTSRGVTMINGPVDRSWGIRTACFADPAGHVWEIAGPLAANPAERAANPAEPAEDAAEPAAEPA
jgi:catechol 2,3-dioxygenase-like lactoylglutathione lyase family enzyme